MRAFDPWPGAYMDFEGANLKIRRAHVEVRNAAAGQRLVWENQPAVGAGGGILVLDEVQRFGREPRARRRVLGRLAAAFRKIGGHRRLGFPKLDDYSRERLGLSGRELQSLAAVSVRLGELPSVAEAFERGELSWSQVRLVAAVARPGSEAQWLERARGRSVRALMRERIDALSPDQELCIVAFAKSARKVTGFSNNKSELRDAVSRLEVEDVSGQLDDALRLAQALAHLPHHLAALRCGHVAPAQGDLEKERGAGVR